MALALEGAYRQMLFIRALEVLLVELYEQLHVRGTAHPVRLGMEAIAVGACAALRNGD